MDIFVEYLDGDYAVCRLPDKAGNLIRLPLKELPRGTAPLKVISMRDNGSFVLHVLFYSALEHGRLYNFHFGFSLRHK